MIFDFSEANKSDDPILRALFSAENLETIQEGPNIEGSVFEYTIIPAAEIISSIVNYDCIQS